MVAVSPIDAIIKKQAVLILDGGLATELEKMNLVLDTPLWSAEVMLTRPDAIKNVHLSYLQAGADCIISATYQISFAGCMKIGMSELEVVDLLRATVDLACEARDEFWQNKNQKDKSRIKPLVAASVGPYGAFLANGPEYTGNYGISADELYDFHEKRFAVLASTGADLLACETIPSKVEAEVLARLIEETPGVYAYISFSCKDDEHINDGTPIRECAALFEKADQVLAVGINCTSPVHLSGLIGKLREGSKPIVVYPNSGETYNVATHTWVGAAEPIDFAEAAEQWREAGAVMIGGCCRTGPEEISAIRERLAGSKG